MAFLNEWKKRAERRGQTYQVIMEDLVEMGIVGHDAYCKLIGRDPNARREVDAPPAPEPIVEPTFTTTETFDDE